MRNLWLGMVALLAFGAVSCEETDVKDVETAAIAISGVEATETSVTFTLTPAHAKYFTYAVAVKGEQAEAVRVEGTEKTTKTVEGLTADTEYIITAIAYNLVEEASTPVTAEFKTLAAEVVEQPTIAFDEEVVVAETTATLTVELTKAAGFAYGYFVTPAEGEARPAFEYTEVETTEATASIELTELAPATNYTVVAYAFGEDEENRSEEAVATFTTKAAEPVDEFGKYLKVNAFYAAGTFGNIWADFEIVGDIEGYYFGGSFLDPEADTSSFESFLAGVNAPADQPWLALPLMTESMKNLRISGVVPDNEEGTIYFWVGAKVDGKVTEATSKCIAVSYKTACTPVSTMKLDFDVENTNVVYSGYAWGDAFALTVPVTFPEEAVLYSAQAYKTSQYQTAEEAVEGFFAAMTDYARLELVTSLTSIEMDVWDSAGDYWIVMTVINNKGEIASAVAKTITLKKEEGGQPGAAVKSLVINSEGGVAGGFKVSFSAEGEGADFTKVKYSVLETESMDDRIVWFEMWLPDPLFPGMINDLDLASLANGVLTVTSGYGISSMTDGTCYSIIAAPVAADGTVGESVELMHTAGANGAVVGGEGGGDVPTDFDFMVVDAELEDVAGTKTLYFEWEYEGIEKFYYINWSRSMWEDDMEFEDPETRQMVISMLISQGAPDLQVLYTSDLDAEGNYTFEGLEAGVEYIFVGAPATANNTIGVGTELIYTAAGGAVAEKPSFTVAVATGVEDEPLTRTLNFSLSENTAKIFYTVQSLSTLQNGWGLTTDAEYVKYLDDNFILWEEMYPGYGYCPTLLPSDLDANGNWPYDGSAYERSNEFVFIGRAVDANGVQGDGVCLKFKTEEPAALAQPKNITLSDLGGVAGGYKVGFAATGEGNDIYRVAYMLKESTYTTWGSNADARASYVELNQQYGNPDGLLSYLYWEVIMEYSYEISFTGLTDGKEYILVALPVASDGGYSNATEITFTAGEAGGAVEAPSFTITPLDVADQPKQRTFELKLSENCVKIKWEYAKASQLSHYTTDQQFYDYLDLFIDAGEYRTLNYTDVSLENTWTFNNAYASADTEYYFIGRAYDADGNGGEYAYVKFRTAAEAPVVEDFTLTSYELTLAENLPGMVKLMVNYEGDGVAAAAGIEYCIEEDSFWNNGDMTTDSSKISWANSSYSTKKTALFSDIDAFMGEPGEYEWYNYLGASGAHTMVWRIVTADGQHTDGKILAGLNPTAENTEW